MRDGEKDLVILEFFHLSLVLCRPLFFPRFCGCESLHFRYFPGAQFGFLNLVTHPKVFTSTIVIYVLLITLFLSRWKTLYQNIMRFFKRSWIHCQKSRSHLKDKSNISFIAIDCFSLKRVLNIL